MKIFSSMLFLMAVYIAAPDSRRLIQFFFFHKPTSLKLLPRPIFKKWGRTSALIFKTALILSFVIPTIYQSHNAIKEYGEEAPKPSLYGYYNVETFVKNSDTLAPLITDKVRWNKIVFSEYNRITVRLMNDTLLTYNYEEDSLHRLKLSLRNDTVLQHTFSYLSMNKEVIDLKNHDSRDSLYMRLRKINADSFLLMKRGFHWINEYPLNR